MNRDSLQYLESWKTKPDRKPLMMRGARQVGKTHLVRDFAVKKFGQFLELNFEKKLEDKELFQNRSPQKIIQLLELEYHVKINPGQTLLFLDEIQAAPEVIPVLRYFYEELPDLHIIAAGSLLDFVLSEHNFSMPVGRVEYLHLGPLSFEEFLEALDEESLRQYLCEFNFKEKISTSLHQKLMGYVKEYCLVGGMPAAIKAYAVERSNEECNQIKQNILSTCQDDFGKYGHRVPYVRLRKVFRQIPLLVGEKIKYVNIDPFERAKDLSEAIHLLSLARICHPVTHTSANGIPLRAEIKEKIFKLLFIDIGLMSSACGLNLLDFEKAADLQLVNQGKLSEQFIGQHLLYSLPCYQEPEIFYWMREQRNSSAEVDYVISQGSSIVPVEVKSGKTGTLKSLQLFSKEKKIEKALRFCSQPPSIWKDQFTLISLPFYLVGQTRRLLPLSPD